MHSEGILAGELKHGPLALIDKQMPVIMVIMKDPCFAKCQNALQQVTARQVRPLCQAGPLFSCSLPHMPTSPTICQHQLWVFLLGSRHEHTLSPGASHAWCTFRKGLASLRPCPQKHLGEAQ